MCVISFNFKLDYCSEQDQIVATVKNGFISMNAVKNQVFFWGQVSRPSWPKEESGLEHNVFWPRGCRHMPLFKCPLFHLTPIDQV